MSLSMFDLTGKTAVVTGAGRGLGRAMAIGLASCGANVVCAARTKSEIEVTVAEIKAAGGNAIAVVTDITKTADCEAAVKAAVVSFGGIDIMVANAAAGIHGPAKGMPDSDWDRVLEVGLTGYFKCARAAGEQMIAQGRGGSIIGLSANSSVVGYEGLTAVGAAKGGLDQMCRTLAVEWGSHQIRVNTVNPGYTEHVPEYGDVSPGAGGDIDEGVRMMTPMQRRGRVDEFIGPVVFLASDASSYVTGTNMMVDGGYVVK